MFVVADPCSVLLVLMLMCVCMLNVLQPEQQSECESIKWEGGLSGWWVVGGGTQTSRAAGTMHSERLKEPLVQLGSVEGGTSGAGGTQSEHSS